VAIIVAVAAIWFVGSRPVGAAGRSRDDVQWRVSVEDGPHDLAADAGGIAVVTSALSVYLLTTSGHVRWRAPVDDLALGQPALGRVVVVVGGNRSVTALTRADGSVRWRRPWSSPVQSVTATGADVLVGDDSGTLTALDATTGRTRWSAQHPGALWSGARVDPATGAVVATWHQSEEPAVRVYDLASGSLRWAAPTARHAAASTVGEGRVVLAIGDGDRHARAEARDVTTGAVLWQTRLPASFEEAIEPALDHRGLAVVDHFGVVSYLDPDTGHLRWQHDLADVLVGTRVVLSDHRVAFTSYRGVLHVLDRRDGREVDRIGPARIGGLVVSSSPARGPHQGGVLLAVRLRHWGVQLRRLP
jgi:outer membrane protein assembly factor BamB